MILLIIQCSVAVGCVALALLLVVGLCAAVMSFRDEWFR